MIKRNKDYVFGLDIGTRSVVGTVGYRAGTDRFVVEAQVSLEHTTRAVIDGQIHDIPAVTKTILKVKEQLEEMIDGTLIDVSIAAAGRVLKTKNVYVEYEMPGEARVTGEDIRILDNLAVEKAYREIQGEVDHKDKHFYCVGYSPVKYYLNGYPMEMIEKHMASSIGVDMIATFLPDEVVEGLYSAVEAADLKVSSLTLEPIAAINVAIPERFRLLNIALVDVGAGTSDISIVKDGSIIAFGMMPLAGDEITEAIAKRYLIDFETAERVKKGISKRKIITVKNIMGETYKLTREEIQETAKEAVASIVDKVADKIIELNGGSVSAVFIVGGGAKISGFTERMAERLELPQNRVAIRGSEVLQQVDFSLTGVKKDSTLVTPIGICMEYYEQKSNFVHVRVNEERVRLYDNGKVTVLDACIHAGYSQASLFPSRGEGFTYTVNGEEREAKGRLGEPAEVHINEKEGSLNEILKADDVIVVRPATKGEAASLTLKRIPECRVENKYSLFGRVLLCPPRVRVNGELQTLDYEVQAGDAVKVQSTYTLRELFEFADLPKEEKVLVDGEEKGLEYRLGDGAKIEHIVPEEPPKPKRKGGKPPRKTVVSDLVSDVAPAAGGDPLLAPVRPLPAWAADLPISNPAAHGLVSPAPQVPTAAYGTAPAASPAVQAGGYGDRSIEIKVNDQKVNLLPKSSHTFVDVFDAYPFDLTKPGGKRMVSKLNGMDVSDFTLPVREGDKIELYWEK